MSYTKIIAFITSVVLCLSFVGCKKEDGEESKERIINSPYAYSVNGKTIHHSGCFHVKRISDENLVEYYGDPQDMVASGYKLCKSCFPNSDVDTDTGTDEVLIEEEDATYVINIGTGRFHEKDCDYAIGANAENKKYTDLTYEELVNENYEPCQVCLKNYSSDN